MITTEEKGYICNNNTKPENQPSLKNERGDNCALMVVISALYLLTIIDSACGSLQGPFFSREVSEKGASTTIFGLINGCLYLAVFFSAPIVGKLQISVRNPECFIYIGAVTSGICSMAFGFLTYVPDTQTFVALSFTIRIIDGIGGTFLRVSSLTLGPALFPEKATTIFGFLRTCTGVGAMFGPLVGGVLYDLGGFILPFTLLGSLLFPGALMIFFYLKKCEKREKPMKGTTVWRFWFDIGIWVYFIDAVIYIAVYVSFSSTLEHHLRSFSLSGFEIGLVFATTGILIGVTAPICGWILDKKDVSTFVDISGTLLMMLSQIFVGPMPFLQLKKTLLLVYISRAILGIGVGLKFLSTFSGLAKDSINRGYEKNIEMYGLITSVCLTCQCLGCFVGPVISGYAYDALGFDGSIMVNIYAQSFALALTVMYFIYRRIRWQPKKDKIDETSKLSSPIAQSTYL